MTHPLRFPMFLRKYLEKIITGMIWLIPTKIVFFIQAYIPFLLRVFINVIGWLFFYQVPILFQLVEHNFDL
jgi:hypothetical protein